MSRNPDLVALLIEGYLIGLLVREKKVDELPFRLKDITTDLAEGTILTMASGNKYKLTVDFVP